ncbi:hemolysin family protein [Canibacter sp. lx-72]|uniref:hemolysin family protein n=1 Tax=Canibacter zhuwentaonis TaxID=2837491 RepID=UPI001BDBFB36|nr:hemolysin family protein [Canibacter zhuwentaonis]
MNPLFAGILVVVSIVLILHAGLLAAAEAALNVRSRAELLKLAESAKKSRRAIVQIAEDEVSHLLSIAFARIAGESLAAVFLTVVYTTVFTNIWVVLSLSSLTVLLATFVLVGTSPRRIGRAIPSGVIRLTAPLVRAVRVVLGPLAIAIMRFHTAVLNGGVSQFERESLSGDSELLSLVDRAAEHDALEEEDRDYIHSLLKFGDTPVSEIIVPRTDMKTLEYKTDICAALDTLLANRTSRMPVITENADDVIGIIHLRDVAGFFFRHSAEAAIVPVTKLMRQALFVPDLMRADDLLAQMQRENNHLALTVDEYGGISGLVTLEDLIEELIGDIYDEHDRADQCYTENVDGSFNISPRLLVSELGDLFEIELTDEDVDTAAGLFVKELGRLAEADDSVVVAGIKLTATKVDRRGAVQHIVAKRQTVAELAVADTDKIEAAEG